MLLDGKTCVVTGGNTGIGEAIVRAAANEGANVVVGYFENPGTANSLVGEIEAGGGRAVAVFADVRRVDDIAGLISTAVQSFGSLSVMINNAGIQTLNSLLETSEQDFDRTLDVNLKAAFFGSQLASLQFIEQNSAGVIVNVSSIHEEWPMPGNTAYCVSKGGVRMLTKTAGVELAGTGIRILNVAPGATATRLTASLFNSPAEMKAVEAAIPAGRIAAPSEIADVVIFLASDAARYMTATTVYVDGGLMVAGPHR